MSCCPHERMHSCNSNLIMVVEPPALRCQAAAAAHASKGGSFSFCWKLCASGRTRPTSKINSSSKGSAGWDCFFSLSWTDGCQKNVPIEPKIVQGYLFYLNHSLGTALNPKAWASLFAVASPFPSADTLLRNEDIVWSISKCGTSASTVVRTNFTQLASLKWKDHQRTT